MRSFQIIKTDNKLSHKDMTLQLAITTIGNSPKNDFYNQICF